MEMDGQPIEVNLMNLPKRARDAVQEQVMFLKAGHINAMKSYREHAEGMGEDFQPIAERMSGSMLAEHAGKLAAGAAAVGAYYAHLVLPPAELVKLRDRITAKLDADRASVDKEDAAGTAGAMNWASIGVVDPTEGE